MELQDVVSLDIDGKREYGTILAIDGERAKVRVDLMRGGVTTAYRLLSELTPIYGRNDIKTHNA